MKLLRTSWLILGALLAPAAPAPAQLSTQEVPKEIKPPFGLGWGETQERLQRLLTGAKATIVTRRRTLDNREAWDVEGLVQTGLRRTVFYFRKGELNEVELQYQKEEWDEAKYDDFMGQVRRRIEQRYGAGQQIVRKTAPEGTVMQTVIGYSWNLNNTEIDLYYYSAKDESHTFRTLSVHYKTM
ncbi:MAG TPA: hypothetical protein VGO11_24530 [Chthoniobacteraceae bacterium]|nr:hypothetical protein [Chthoniobacteraceae bacterium]